MKIYTVHGRFQPLHLGHLNDYFLPVKKKCDLLVVGITNPDPHLTLDDSTNLARTNAYNNPLSYYERHSIIHDALIEYGLGTNEFRIVPFPINLPQLIASYVPKDTTHYLTIFDDWGNKKLKVLGENNLKTKVLFKKPISEKKISSTMVRDAIVSGRSWRHLVPNKCAESLENLDIRPRLITLRNHTN